MILGLAVQESLLQALLDFPFLDFRGLVSGTEGGQNEDWLPTVGREETDYLLCVEILSEMMLGSRISGNN